MQWDSPLFNASGSIGLEDVTGDGRPEIIADAMTPGNQIYPILVIFDQDGHELTRQSRCDTFNEAFDSVDGVCAIKGTNIALGTNESGTKTISVEGWNGEDHVFRLRGGKYVPGPAVEGR